jgi:hypothetical protein
MLKALVAALACICGCLTIAVPSVSARQVSQISFAAPWTGGAFTNDQTSQFSGCAASAKYLSGITMVVMITRAGGWSLAFGDDAWNLQPKQQIALAMTFDGQNPWSGMANTVNPHLASVTMATDSTLINAFRGAYQMQVQAEGRIFAFNLGGTSRLMVQLAQCVTTQLAIERGEPPPSFITTPATPPSAPGAPTTAAASNAQIELAATRIASNLLLQAKLSNARLLSPNETPVGLRGRGAVWTSDAGLGVVELIAAPPGKDAQQVASSLVSDDANSCKGEFASGRSSELVDDKVITKAFTGCKDSNGVRAFRYFVVPTPNGPFVVYGLAGNNVAPPSQDSPLSDTHFQAAALKAAYSP